MKHFSLVATLLSCVVAASPAFSAAPTAVKKPSSQPAAKKTNMQYPFINGHYAMTGVMKTNGYRADAPTVVVVDKGSHSTHILQLQHLGKRDEIVRVMTVSNAIGT